MNVMLRGKNSFSMLLCQLELLQLGARILPLNPQLSESTVVELITGLSVDYLIDFTGQQLFLPKVKLLDYRAVIAKSVNLQHDVTGQLPFMPSLPVILILTSGLTGMAKAVVHNITAYLNSAKGVLSLLPFEREDCWLLSLPLFHVSGQGIVWRWLYRGERLAITATISLRYALQQCNHAFLVPT